MLRRLITFLFWLLVLLILVLAIFRVAASWREVRALEDVIPFEGRVIETQMGKIYVEEHGPEDGQLVLLAHGSVGWAGFWDETLRDLAKNGYRAIAFDMPPMGFSDRDESGDYARQTQAKRLLALVETFNTKPILAAHSFGAGAGTEAVLMQPEAFAAYIIIDGAVGVNSHLKDTKFPAILGPMWLRETVVSATITNPLLSRWLLQQFLHRKDRATDEYLQVLSRPAVLEGSTREVARWLPSLVVPPKDALSTRPDEIAKITLPTAILWGAEDTTTPLAQGQKLNALIEGSELIVMPGVGHIPQIEDPALFMEALLTALGNF